MSKPLWFVTEIASRYDGSDAWGFQARDEADQLIVETWGRTKALSVERMKRYADIEGVRLRWRKY